MRQDRVSRWARRLLPAGRALPGEMWNRRHRGIVIALWCHVPALLLFGVLSKHSLVHTLIDVSPVIVLATLASRDCFSRLLRSSLATVGLVVCSALAVHFSRGNIEMHFHFFVVVGVITLYQEWVPFGVALVFVVLHHGVMGVVAPSSVYDHKSAIQDPWLWAAIHGAFVLAASVPHILAWRLNEDQALRDPLTRLPNRTLFGDRLNHALARRDRYGDQPAVLFVDLDRFKQVNDTLGHTMGDQILVAAAERLEQAIRQTDTAARFGGDEFAILLEGRGAVTPERSADRLLRALREPIVIGDREVFLNASIGIALAPGTTTVEDVLRNADLAMYMAKASGRGRYELFDQSMHERAVENVELEDDLRRALDNHTLSVEYQPTVALASGRVVGVEALARWHHPARGNIPPLVFIPIAERSGLIGRLGLEVLTYACRTARLLHEVDPTLDMNVNLSPHQLADPGLVDSVERVLSETGLDAHRLVLEITENVLMDDVNLTTERLSALKALGVRIAIDDFGTGYSSLSYLRHFPVDVLKIDRSFVETLPGTGTELARTILRLGQTLQLEVVAEGIETPPQLAELNELGCSQGQGFLFARPMPFAELKILIAKAAAEGLRWQDSLVDQG